MTFACMCRVFIAFFTPGWLYSSIEMLLSTGMLEIPEINNKGMGIEYRPGVYLILLRPESVMKC